MTDRFFLSLQEYYRNGDVYKMRMLNPIFLLSVIILVTVALIPSSFADTTVSITAGSGSSAMCSTHDTCYDPDTVTIQQGETVTWINQDSVGHMISENSNDKQTGTILHSKFMSSGDSFAFTFSQAGTYNYFDLYTWMVGKIIVTPSTQSTPSPPSILQSTSSFQINTIPQWVKNNAKLWADGQISESEFIKGIQYLIDNNILRVSNQDELNRLVTDNTNLQLQNQNLQTQLQQDEEKLTMWNEYHTRVQSFFQNFNSTIQQAVQVEKCKPLTSIKNGTYIWNFCDSKGNPYTWSMPTTTYDNIIKRPFPVDTISIKEPDGTVVVWPDYRKFVEPSFSKVIDQVYDNAGSDQQFLYETWFIVSQMTTYSQDITNSNLWPLQTFSDAKGDCKDLSILLASMLRSSSHTQNWKIYLGILDANNPSDPKIYNHMMVSVHIDNNTQFIEATAKQNGLNAWNVMLGGYWLPV